MSWLPRPAVARGVYPLALAVVFAIGWAALALASGPGVWTLRPVERLTASGVVHSITGDLEPSASAPITLEVELAPNARIRRPGTEPGYWLVNRPVTGTASIDSPRFEARAHLGASQLLVVANLGYWVLVPLSAVLFLVASYFLGGHQEDPERQLVFARLGLVIVAVLAAVPGLPGLLWAFSRFTRGLPGP